MAVSALNYNHLRYFWAVAHEGNLTRTAERLNVSQSALSVQIQKLEARLGHALFERRGKQLVLTEAGRIALDHADAIFGAGAELEAALSAAGATRHVLRVGAVATLSRNFQLRFLLPTLHRDDVEVVVRSGGLAELVAGLEALRLDLVLTTTVPARDAATSWHAHEVAEEPATLVGTPARIASGDDLAGLLAREPVVLPTPESGLRLGFDALASRLGLRPRVAAEVDDMAMLRLLARADIGLALLPPIVVRDELQNGRLIVAEAFPRLTERFYALTPVRRFASPLVAELLDAARSGSP
jgi:LysR family transcriptional regulator, transcriptional activator of nhaA